MVNYRWPPIDGFWDDIPSTFLSLACACAEKAKENGWQYFGLQFWGECWGGPSLEYDKYGPSAECKANTKDPATGKYGSCDDASAGECVGLQWSNYVYKLKDSQPDWHKIVMH